MTLGEFFQFIGAHPSYVATYFLAIPALAFFANWVASGEGHLAPWKYLYSVLIFAACVPGVFSVGLSVYNFLFERGSLMNANVLTQILPVLSMAVTIATVRRNVPLEYVPGSERISSLITLIGAVLVLMYIVDRTRLFVFVSMPVGTFLLVLAGLLLAVRFAARKILA